MEILLLTIANLGLQYSFLNQAIEVETMRERLADLAGATDPPQLLIRVGSAPQVERRIPRRPLQRVLTPGQLRDVSYGK